MAVMVIHAPGTKRGPCYICTHVECAHDRTMAGESCTYCGEPIGYEREFYAASAYQFIHADCKEKAIEEARK